MARRRDFARGAVAIRSSRLTTWFQFLPTEVTQASNSAATLMFVLNATALAMRPFTIVRSHFLVAIGTDQTGSLEAQRAAIGIAVVSEQAVDVGISAVPTPILDMSSNLWMLHQVLYADESQLADNRSPESVYSIDSKAMRKVELGQDLAIVVEGAGFGGGVQITVGGRMLIKNN